MKIVYLVAGAGGMYCGACLHGNTLAAAVHQAGHEVLVAPAYTPVLTDEEAAPAGKIFFGGINVYLQQKWSLFRRMPWRIDRLLDQPGLLRWIGKFGPSTRPEELGALAVSMLRGQEGRQRKELDKLLAWLEGKVRPDVVHLSTVMLAGVAGEIVRRLEARVVGTLAGEDLFIEQMPEPHRAEARALLAKRCAQLTALVALNDYYAEFMAGYLGLGRERIRVIRPGVNLSGHRSPGELRPSGPATHRASGKVTIGYLARVCPEKGLHLLAEAFDLLAHDDRLPPTRLVAAGYLSPADRPYLAAIQNQLDERGLADRFQYAGAVDRAAKIALLDTFDVMCVPTVYPESKGLSVLEAWANGVPVVLPDHGAFPEMIADTGGGLLARPRDAGALADALRRLILDPQQAAECGRRAQQAVHQRYHAERMAQETVALYETLLGEMG